MTPLGLMMSLAGEQSPPVVQHPDAVTFPTSVSDQVPYVLQICRHLAVVLPQGHANFTQLFGSLHCLIVLQAFACRIRESKDPGPPLWSAMMLLQFANLYNMSPQPW